MPSWWFAAGVVPSSPFECCRCCLQGKGYCIVSHNTFMIQSRGVTIKLPRLRSGYEAALKGPPALIGDNEDILLPGTARLRVQLGVNMSVQATRKLGVIDNIPSLITYSICL
ncbi:Phosphatidylinositol-4-phosphate 5-kinase 8 [Sesbania bispinosa]|nr:Phosphatidylinositol-4-phosphate 5-kinase 8 [Sesbania bispinosa]